MRKIFFFSLLLLAAVPVVIAQNNSSKLTVALKAGKVTVNKKEISKDWTIESAAKILDKGTRTVPGNYVKHIFDNLGLVLFERTESKVANGELAELQLFIDATEEADYTPKEFYEGKLKVEEINIDHNSSIETIRTTLKDYKEKEMPEDDTYRFSKDGVYILLRYNDQNRLQKVCFGKDKPQA